MSKHLTGPTEGDHVREIATGRVGVVIQTRTFGLRVEWTSHPMYPMRNDRTWQSWHGYGAVQVISELEQTADHIAADKDHTPVPVSAYQDDISDNCAQCGLATTPDGKHHGFLS